MPTGSTRLLCRIEETWRLWCKFLDDYSRFEDWLNMAERTAASPNSADVLYTVAKEELKKFEVGLKKNTNLLMFACFPSSRLELKLEYLLFWRLLISPAETCLTALSSVSVQGLQRQVQERLTHLELVNNQYRRLARENRTDRASQLKAMVHEGNRRWDTLHRRVAAIVRRLKVDGWRERWVDGRMDFQSYVKYIFPSTFLVVFHRPERGV